MTTWNEDELPELAGLLDSLSVAAFVCDSEGAVVRFNSRARELWGRAPDVPVGDGPPGASDPFRWPNGTAPPGGRSPVTEALAGGNPQTTAVTLEQPDGELRRVLMSVTPLLDAAGSVSGGVALVVDITEPVRASELAARSRRLDAVAEVASETALEFGELFAHVDAWARRVASAQDRTTVEDGVRHILEAAAKGQQLGGTLARLGSHLPMPQDACLNAVIRGLEDAIRRRTGKDVELVLDPDVGPVAGNETYLEWIVLDMVSLAAARAPSAATLEIRTTGVRRDRDAARLAKGPYARLSISATGPSISGAAAYGAEAGGGALRKVVLEGLVERLGGQVLGRRGGAGMVVDLPFFDREAPSGEPRARILVVDDDARLRSLVQRVLEQHDFEVVAAEDGEAALQVLADSPSSIDVVLSDVVMPRLGGLELRERAAKIAPDIRIILMSGFTMPKHDPSRLDEEWFLAKPFTPAELLAALDRALAEARDLPTAEPIPMVEREANRA